MKKRDDFDQVEEFAKKLKERISRILCELKANWATQQFDNPLEKVMHEATSGCVTNTLIVMRDFTIDGVLMEFKGGSK